MCIKRNILRPFFCLKNFLLLVVIIFIASCNNNSESYIVVEKEFNKAVYASGTIYPVKYNFIKSDNGYTLTSLKVKEGDVIKNGDVLAELSLINGSDKNIIEKQINLANSNLSQNSALFNELKTKLNLAKLKFESDKKNADNYRELLQIDAVSEKDANNAIIQSNISRAEYDELTFQFESLKRKLENELLDSQKQLLNYRKIIKSNLDGKVLSIDKKIGDYISDNEVIMFIGQDDEFKIELLVDERDISKIEVNQMVYFNSDIYPDEQFKASIIKINPVLEQKTRSFKVEALITEVPVTFYLLTSVEANIMIQENAKGILIPTSFIENGYVYLENNDSIITQQVKTGERIKDWIEIKTGLKVNDKIVKQ